MPTRDSTVKRCLRPGAPGTRKLMLQHGSDLVCVRYRESEDGLLRMTTIELIIDRRPSPQTAVNVDVRWNDAALRAKLLEHGARWDAKKRCWTTDLQTIRRLNLYDKIKRLP
jgi:hypothetical protein